MRTMANLVSEIVNMNSKDLEMLAQGICWFSMGTTDQAEKLKFFLDNHIREQRERREKIFGKTSLESTV